MSDLDHRIFEWRPEIRSRTEAEVAAEMIVKLDQGLALVDEHDESSPSLEAMREKIAVALEEWRARPWWVRVAGRRHVSPDAVTFRRWMEHARAYLQRALAHDDDV